MKEEEDKSRSIKYICECIVWVVFILAVCYGCTHGGFK